MNEEKIANEEDKTIWPPHPNSPVPPIPKPLGWFRPMADVPFWVLPILAVFYILMFTGIYFLALYPGNRPFVLVNALIIGPGLGLLLSFFYFWVWLGARKQRRDKGD